MLPSLNPLSSPFYPRHALQKRSRAYYSGHYHGAPASVVAAELAHALACLRNDMLWLGIVGLTDVSACGSVRRNHKCQCLTA